MRAILILTVACASIAFTAGAQAQEAVRLCRQIKDDADRLKCYDRIDTPSPSAAGTPTEAAAAWEVSEEKSPLDDTPLVSAMLRSSDDKAQLLMRCKERKTEVAVLIRGFIKCGADVRVIYRVDQGQSVDGPWNSSKSCYLAIAPSPIPFIRALADQSKVYFRLYDHHGAPNDALFNVGKVSEVRSRLAKACEWDEATGNPVSKSPAPAASPSPSRATPK
jgi:Type VI secretion system VasI, EvfG, VC_A0118